MTQGIFDDELLIQESPVESGQGSEEQAAGPDQGQPAEVETGATEEAAQEQETPQEQQQLILGKFKSVDDLAKSYDELQRKLGARDEEKEQLRQQLAMLQGYLQALPQLMGQQVPQVQQVQGQPQAQAAVDEHEKVLHELEELYPGLTKAIEKRSERLVSERLSQLEKKLSETLTPVQQFMTQEYFNRQALQLAGKYPDFREVAQDMMAVYQEQPMLAALPNSMEVAYQIAKARKTLAATQATQTATEKQAARIPGSTGPRAAKPADLEKQFLEQIFGNSNEPKGIFDDL